MERSNKESSDDEDMDDFLEPEDLFNDEPRDSQNDEKSDEKPKVEKLEKKAKQLGVEKKPKKTPNYETLRGDNGLSALKKLFTNFKFKGNGHEKEDLTNIMGILQQWVCYQLCPQYDFESGMLELEALGKKRIIKTLMQRYRLGIDDWGENQPNAEVAAENAQITENTNEFDVLINEEEANIRSDDELNQNEAQKQPEVMLSQEQLERIARNRKLAEERRLKRMSEKHQAMEAKRYNEEGISPDGRY